MMELFPMIQPPEETTEQPLPLYREVAWDFAAGKPIFRSGNPIYVTGAEAVKVWCWKALNTPRTRYPIYSWDYGSELESLIGQNFSGELKRAEAVRYVREALQINPYITEITNIQVDFQRGRLSIFAAIQTVYGEVNLHV